MDRRIATDKGEMMATIELTKQMTLLQTLEWLKQESDCRMWFDGNIDEWHKAWETIETALKSLEAIEQRAEEIRSVCELKIDANKQPRQNEDGTYSYFIHAEAQMHVIDFIMCGKETK